MIQLKQALQIAGDKFKELGLSNIVEAYQTDNSYLFFGADADYVIAGEYGLKVDKNTGNTVCFLCNSSDAVAFLDMATEVPLA